MNEHEISWLAGYLEGEGSFGVDKRNGSIFIEVRTTDEDVAQKVASLMGSPSVRGYDPGTYVYKGTQKPVKRWYDTRVYNKVAASIMMQIFPFMGARRKVRILELLTNYKEKLL